MKQISLVSSDPTIKNFTKNQLHVFWLAEEIKVEKDIQDILVNMTESEKHGVITTLRLFSSYELAAGSEFWSTRYKEMFADSIDHIEMASVFSMFELAVHLQFYKKLNECLYIDTDEFYNSYLQDATLVSRMEHIDSIVNSKNDLLSLAMFSVVEGAILYSSFAFLKHFQSQGKNKLMNICRGINFSVRDENLHSIAGAYSFKKKLSQSNLTESELSVLHESIVKGCEQIYEHECRIVDMVFEKGKIDGITSTQMKNFVEARINLCLQELGMPKFYNITYDPISSWFYDGINGFSYNDFFTAVGNSYNRNWSETEFTWE